MAPLGNHATHRATPPNPDEEIAMNKFGAIASLVAASAFASHLNAELYRSADKTPAPAQTAKKDAK